MRRLPRTASARTTLHPTSIWHPAKAASKGEAVGGDSEIVVDAKHNLWLIFLTLPPIWEPYDIDNHSHLDNYPRVTASGVLS